MVRAGKPVGLQTARRKRPEFSFDRQRKANAIRLKSGAWNTHSGLTKFQCQENNFYGRMYGITGFQGSNRRSRSGNHALTPVRTGNVLSEYVSEEHVR